MGHFAKLPIARVQLGGSVADAPLVGRDHGVPHRSNRDHSGSNCRAGVVAQAVAELDALCHRGCCSPGSRHLCADRGDENLPSYQDQAIGIGSAPPDPALPLSDTHQSMNDTAASASPSAFEANSSPESVAIVQWPEREARDAAMKTDRVPPSTHVPISAATRTP